jgi:hypothetical protein
MKTAIILLGLCSFAALADDPAPAAKKKTTKTAAKKPAPAGLTIPAGATENPDGTFSWTDKSGKKWRFAKTPFGIMRSPDTSAADATASDPNEQQLVKATDNGDTVTLVRQTPFGPIKQEKKKSELTDAERKLLEDQKAKP